MKKFNENLNVASSSKKIVVRKPREKAVETKAVETQAEQATSENVDFSVFRKAMHEFAHAPISDNALTLFDLILELQGNGATKTEILHNKNVFALLQQTPKTERGFVVPLLDIEESISAIYQARKETALQRVTELTKDATSFDAIENYWKTCGDFERACIVDNIIQGKASYLQLFVCADFAEKVFCLLGKQYEPLKKDHTNKSRYLIAYHETFGELCLPLTNSMTRIVNNIVDDDGKYRKYAELVASAASLNRKTMCASYLLQAYCYTAKTTYYPVYWNNTTLYDACKRNNSAGRCDFLPYLVLSGYISKNDIAYYIYNAGLTSVDFNAETKFDWERQNDAEKVDTIWGYIEAKVAQLKQKAFKAPKGASAIKHIKPEKAQVEPELIITDDMLADLL